jgi:hypothetical protein
MKPRRTRSFAPSTREAPIAVATPAAAAPFAKSLRVSSLILVLPSPGQANFVPMTPPTPKVEAKSVPPSLISTWSPK